jgi:hypothetical protein
VAAASGGGFKSPGMSVCAIVSLAKLAIRAVFEYISGSNFMMPQAVALLIYRAGQVTMLLINVVPRRSSCVARGYSCGICRCHQGATNSRSPRKMLLLPPLQPLPSQR